MSDDSAALPCADKLVFDSKTAALGTAATLRYQKGTKLKPYVCRHCGLWHLSSL